MPSAEHEGQIEFIRGDPALAINLMRASRTPVPQHDEIAIAPSAVGKTVSGHHADVLLLVKRAGKTVLVVIIEIQRKRDERKALVWTLYASSASVRHGCPTLLPVYATTPQVAHWAKHELVFWNLAGRSCRPDDRPIVLAASEVPAPTLPEALARPYLAAFPAAARAHGADGLAAVRLALDAAALLPDETSIIVRDTVFSVLDGAMRLAITKDLSMQGYVLKSDVMRTWQAEAIAEGEAKGARALRETLHAVRHARGLVVDDLTAARVSATVDLAVLQRWVVSAATATTVDEVFVD